MKSLASRYPAEYRAWYSMKYRCSNEKDISYKNYGGRGISVCDRWVNSFENFFADMGERPEGLTIDRIDNNQGYSPENCRWATSLEQSRNRRNSRYITHKGVTKHITDWASGLGLAMSTLEKRLKNWPLDKALSEPRKIRYCAAWAKDNPLHK